MATFSHARAVKSLNKGTAGRRFVFKSCSRRIEEIEVDLFRSLNKIDSSPKEGSSFIKDCLVEWRELNTAEDFISLYEDLLPIVQTLPLVLINKELIFSKILSRLKLEARLSLEPILRLIATLSRDLLADFLAFIPRVVDSVVVLLISGGDKDPEIVKQVCSSWSLILMYLHKYLVRDISETLKITAKLRYYKKSYIQELMTVSTSFLLRNASSNQVAKGIKKLVHELMKNPSATRRFGVSLMLYYAMKGTSLRLHSKALQILRVLTDNTMIIAFEEFEKGSSIVTELVLEVFEKLKEDLSQEELILVLDFLLTKVVNSLSANSPCHLNHLLTILTKVIKLKPASTVFDHQPILRCFELLINHVISTPEKVKELAVNADVAEKILDLILAILGLPNHSLNGSVVSYFVELWAPLIDLKSSSVFPIPCVKAFLRELLQMDYNLIYLCRTNVLRSILSFEYIENEEAILLLVILCKRVQESSDADFFLGVPEAVQLGEFIEASISSSLQLFNSVLLLEKKPFQVALVNLAMLWGIIIAHHYVIGAKYSSAMLMEVISALKSVLRNEQDVIAGINRCIWQYLLGSALRCLKYADIVAPMDSREALLLAEANKFSSHVLSSVSDYLDTIMPDGENKSANIEVDKYIFYSFADNMFNPSKELRIQTLRIMYHIKPSGIDMSTDVKVDSAKMFSSATEVVLLLTKIETTPFSVTSSRSVVLLISKIQMILASHTIDEINLPVVMCGLLGVLQNRFSCYWDSVCECLAYLINKYNSLLWDNFSHYFELCLLTVCSSHFTQNGEKVISKSDDLVGLFRTSMGTTSESNPYTTILSLLLQILQRTPAVADAHSRQLVPWFFRFLNLDGEHMNNLDIYMPDVFNREDMRRILKEWLNLLKLMQNPKALFKSQDLKDVLHYSLLDNKDPDVQVKVLESLLSWKDDFLVPYERNLRSIINPKELREELASWSLSTDSGFINAVHREGLISIVLHILMPKIRSIKLLASRKHASLNLRKAVLRFLSHLSVNEIPQFFMLLLKPLLMTKDADVVSINYFAVHNFPKGVTEKDVLVYLTRDKILALPMKMKYGFLHVVEEVLLTFSEELIKPYLLLLVTITMRVLESCSGCLEAVHSVTDTNFCRTTNESKTQLCLEKVEAEKGEVISSELNPAKELRSICLKVISITLNRYDDHPYNDECWELFFKSIKPFFGKFKQQASSSEQPSVLLSCFLAMSRSTHLVHLLFLDSILIPEILSILTVTSASDSVVSCVISLIRNLLNLDKEMIVSINNNIKGIICPAHIEAIINCLHVFHMGSTRTFAKWEGVSYMSTFTMLSSYLTNAALAGKLLDILLRVLTLKKKDQDGCVECLHIVTAILPFLAPNDIKKILDAVSKFFINAPLEMRLHLCKILQFLSENESSILPVAKLVVDLNATSALEDDNMDYETIVNAYTKVDSGFFYSVNHEQALIVLSQFIYDMSSQNLGIRGYALHSLIIFLEFSALILQEKEDNDRVHKQHFWTKTSVINILMKFLLKHVGNAMKGGSLIKQEWIQLLRKSVVMLPELSSLHSCVVLCSDDVEQDFFYNIAHQQKHRRSRSILRFSAIVTANPVSQGILNQIFLPLFLSIINDTQSDKNDNVKNASIEAVSVIAGYMDWRAYNNLLNVCVREMCNDSKKNKVLARLLSSILDKFNSSWLVSTEGANDAALVKESKIQNQLKVLLNKVQKLLEVDDEKVNASLYLVAVKILKVLPIEVMDLYLSNIMHNIAKGLKSRSEKQRDDSRASLAQCLKELGPEYFAFVINILQAVLKRGYELHVLGYTLHFLLCSLSRNSSSLKLDYCLNELLKAVENDIFGNVAEEKEVEKIAKKMKETKKGKSFETLEIISRSITQKSNAQKLLSIVTSKFQNSVSSDLTKKVQKMLNHISEGLESNQSFDQEDLLIFVFCLIEDGINHEFGLEAHSKSPISNTKSPCYYLITEFALQLFLKYVKKSKSDKNNEKALSMLDPFVPLLALCLKSKYEDILVSTLKILVPLVKFPLPSLLNEADAIKLAIFGISNSSLNSNTSLMQSCLRLLTDLLKSTKIKLSVDHLHMVIQLPLFTDLERNPSFAALSLLRAIVKRKLVVSEIYDIVRSVGELMITSQLEPMRRKCSRIMLQFLLDYRLSDSYMQQYLDFLVKNLSYEHPSGRESVLEMLNVIITKFPLSFLTKHSHTLFIHLVQRLANDDNSILRSMCGAVIKLLLSKTHTNARNSFVEISLSWYLKGTPQLKCVGAQALGFLVEVMGKSFIKHMDSLYQVIGKNLLFNNSWKDVYYTLILLEKTLQSGCVACLRHELKDIWGIVCKLLQHEHSWIRNTSNRLLAMYFSDSKNAEPKRDEDMLFLLNPSKLLVIISSLCCVMKSPDPDDTSVSLLTQNIAFSIFSLHSRVETESPRVDEQGELLKSLEALDYKKGKTIFVYLASNGHQFYRFFISNLIVIMGKIAFTMETLQMKIVFSVFKLIITKGCVDYAYDMLIPLYKASEGYSGKVIPDDMKLLAQEICGALRDIMGINKFAEVYTKVQKKMKMKRDKRRQDDKALAVVHPDRMAKRKLRLSEKNRFRKRRKIMAGKFGRWHIGG